jgi:hypothetical protein
VLCDFGLYVYDGVGLTFIKGILVSIKKAIVLSDLHAGSSYGLLPPNIKLQEGNTVAQNPLQEYLWKCWEDWQGEWFEKHVGDDEFILIINGDATEGVHHGTKEIVSPDPADHRIIALHALSPLAEKASHVFVVEGTECHTANAEHKLAYDLGAVRPKKNSYLSAWRTLRVNIHGCPCMFYHHISTTKRVYLEASQLSIELRNGQLEAVRAGVEPHRVLGCAHRHRYGKYEAGDSLSFVTPPWQGVTRFGRKVVPAAFCEPGVILLDWSEKEHGETPDVHAMVYEPPPSDLEIVEL